MKSNKIARFTYDAPVDSYLLDDENGDLMYYSDYEELLEVVQSLNTALSNFATQLKEQNEIK